MEEFCDLSIPLAIYKCGGDDIVFVGDIFFHLETLVIHSEIPVATLIDDLRPCAIAVTVVDASQMISFQ